MCAIYVPKQWFPFQFKVLPRYKFDLNSFFYAWFKFHVAHTAWNDLSDNANPVTPCVHKMVVYTFKNLQQMLQGFFIAWCAILWT